MLEQASFEKISIEHAKLVAMVAMVKSGVVSAAVFLYAMWHYSGLDLVIAHPGRFWIELLAFFALLLSVCCFCTPEKGSVESRPALFVIMALLGILNLSFLACYSHVGTLAVMFETIVSLFFLSSYLLLNGKQLSDPMNVMVVVGSVVVLTIVIWLSFPSYSVLNAVGCILFSSAIGVAYLNGMSQAVAKKELTASIQTCVSGGTPSSACKWVKASSAVCFEMMDQKRVAACQKLCERSFEGCTVAINEVIMRSCSCACCKSNQVAEQE